MTKRHASRWSLLSAFWMGCAAPSWALSVSPGRTEVRLSPTNSTDILFKAQNDGQEVLHVSLSTKDWFILESNKKRNLFVDTWLQLNGPKEFELKPGESRDVKATVKAPEGAEGDLVAMASFQYVTNPPSMVTPIISVSVYLEIAGTEQVAGEIGKLSVQPWKDQLQLAVSLKSTGNVHLRPTGTMTVLDKKGKDIAHFPLKEGNPAYPGREQAYFAQTLGFTLPPGHYRLVADLAYRGVSFKGEKGFRVLKDGKVEMDTK